jgi:hypothetical protein
MIISEGQKRIRPSLSEWPENAVATTRAIIAAKALEFGVEDIDILYMSRKIKAVQARHAVIHELCHTHKFRHAVIARLMQMDQREVRRLVGAQHESV